MTHIVFVSSAKYLRFNLLGHTRKVSLLVPVQKGMEETGGTVTL